MVLNDYLSPKCSWSTIDLYVVRSRILQALSNQLSEFHGTVLDVGCGYMPYKSLVLSSPSCCERYIGLDLKNNRYTKPDLEWDGETMPLMQGSIDCVIATEVFEHCPKPNNILGEIFRVLKQGGILFFTVPFLWPLHCVPYDQFRFTPFSLQRLLEESGFIQIRLTPLGGWDASLAQMLGLWARRRWSPSRKRTIFSIIIWPIVWYLARSDSRPVSFHDNLMMPGLSGTAKKGH